MTFQPHPPVPPQPSSQPQPYPANRFDRRIVKPTMHPRRVVGGIRLQARIVASAEPGAPASGGGAGWTWASARWMRLAESHAPGDQLAEGLEYAHSGQARSIEFKPGGGMISARVQGRMPAAYKTALRLPTFTHEQWEQVIAAMNQQAKYAAAILSGELPANIEDLFIPLGLRLFPADPSDLSPSCTCSIFTGQPQIATSAAPMGMHSIAPASPAAPPAPEPPVERTSPIPWCKHVCCLMYLVAERLGQQPLSILSLRGMAENDLIERLRQARALAGLQRAGAAGSAALVPSGPSPVYTPHIPLPDRVDEPLPPLPHDFWHAPDPDALADLDCPIAPPEVSHPLLRRLGATPFTGAKFPLVGLLATCYDVISAAAIKADNPAPPDEPADPLDPAPQ